MNGTVGSTKELEKKIIFTVEKKKIIFVVEKKKYF
jgi:hypothetical protein